MSIAIQVENLHKSYLRMAPGFRLRTLKSALLQRSLVGGHREEDTILALEDVSFRIAPLSRSDAEDMIEEIKGHRVLRGIRGQEPADLDAIVDALLCVSRLVTDHRDSIEELDINPLVVFPRGAKAIDALIKTR